MKILLVEDDLSLSMLLRRYLEELGWRDVTRAAYGYDPSLAPYDLVLIDWTRPRLDGLVIVQRIHATERAQRIPLIMITLQDWKEDLTQAIGVDLYLVTPFSRRALRAKIRQARQPSRRGA